MVTKFGTIKVDKLSVSEIDVPSTNSDNQVGTLKLSDNLEVGGDGLILHDLDDYDFSTANIVNGSTTIIYEPNFNTVTIDDGTTTITYSDNSTAVATYESITTITSSVSKTISTAENITIGDTTYSITQSGTTITLVTTATATFISDRVITSSDSTKSSSSEQNITINGRPYTVKQSGPTITLVTVLKKIISLEAGNLVVATYQSDGTRIDKEVIMDSNNSISEIANGAFDLKIKSLDVTDTNTINQSVPSEGCVRIDDTLTVGGATTLSGAVTLGDATGDDITIIGRVASHIVPKTDVAFDLGTTSLGFNDLHLGSGGIINLGGGDVTLTHSAGKLTLGGDGNVEFDFANHEMTNVDIDSGTIDGVTIGTNTACSSLVVTTADINGGTIDNTGIGGSTPVAGTFTVLTVNDELVIAAGATIIGDTEGQITLNVEGAPGQTQDIFTVRQNGAVVNKLEVDANGVTTAASLVATTADINGGAIDGVTIGTNTACSSLVVTTADINGGSIDGTTIGSSSPTTSVFTNSTTNNFIINTPQTINVGGSGITATDTSYTTAPTSSIVYLKATDDSNGSAVTYIWTLDDFTGTAGQMFNIFFNNSADTNVNLKITFGTNGLVTGNGLNEALTFSTQGQSASMVYIDSLWCIINTGAAVS